MYQLWNKFQITCSLLNKKLKRSQRVLSNETIDISVHSEARLQKNFKTGIPNSSAHVATIPLHMKPYKYTVVQKFQTSFRHMILLTASVKHHIMVKLFHC
jgi:hypothetical protein